MKTITLKRKSVDWQGKLTETSLGPFSAWVEEAEVTRWMPERAGELVVGKGTIFLFDWVDDVNKCKVAIDGKEYDIVGVSTFWDDDDSFHHFEIVYR